MLKYQAAIAITALFFTTFSSLAHSSNASNHEDNTNRVDLVISAPPQGKKSRNPFIEELLSQIFTTQNLTLNLIYHQQPLGQNRAVKQLSNDVDIDLNWSVTNVYREEKLRAIKIPIYQGYIGWRVLFIRPDAIEKFNQVKTINDLKNYTAVQRFDWADYEILKDNLLPVEGNLSFVNHSKAVLDGLVDYFPRSVLEAESEITETRNQQLIIEPNLVLKYPSAHYFFVNKNNSALASVIEKGFQALIANGDYQALFNQYFGASLKKLNLENRTVIHLKNASFPNK